MKRILSFIILLFGTLLGSCSNIDDNQPISKRSYDEVSFLFIEYEDIFLPAELEYFVYFFSKSCYHCLKIKDQVIEKTLEDEEKIYFVEYFLGIPILDDVSPTIGATCFEDFGIMGIPSLVRIVDHEVKDNVVGEVEVLFMLGL